MTILAVPVSTLALVAALGLAADAAAQPPRPSQPPSPSPAPVPAPQPPPLAIPPPAPAPAPEPSPDAPLVPLDVQVVISRYQGEKSISRHPYSLAVTANSRNESSLNMGNDVPIPSTTFTPIAPPKPPQGGAPEMVRPLTSMSYRSVGTAISCRATTKEDGRYEVMISVDDTSVISSDQAATSDTVVASMPVFRSFKARNTLILADGQTRQYTAASDRVSGEVVRVEVTLRVVK